MSQETLASRSGRRRASIIAGIVCAVVVLVLLAANGRLLYVAIQSQPECVPHVKPGVTAPDRPSAAQSGC